MPKTALSNSSDIDSKINALLSTNQWGTQNGNPVTITYSFPTSGSTWRSDYANREPFSPNSFLPFSDAQKQDFREALETWSDVANITFIETNDLISQGDIRVAFSTAVDGDTAGYSYGAPEFTAQEYAQRFTNGETVFAASGDIWMNLSQRDLSQEAQNGFSTLVHEIGHSLGLKHPFSTESNNPTVLTGPEDSNQFSVMSYTPYDIGFKAIGGNNFVKASGFTPMLYDIAAIQFLYGANATTRTGNDTYTFSNTEPELKTIWDAAGNDTFDLSNQSLAMNIDLNPGKFSSIGIKYVSNGGFISNTPVTPTKNIAIAYNTSIENAIGGAGNDKITGNSFNNQITGGDGNDSITGGAGIDTSIYSSLKQNYSILKANEAITVTDQRGSEGVDNLSDIERVQFLDQRVAFDTDSNQSAGMAARLLSASFGRDAISNKGYAGIAINLFDNGSTYEQVAQLALSTGLVGGTTNEGVVSAIWKNVVGSEIDNNNLQFYSQALDNGQMTQASLLVLASKTDLTSSLVDSVGINQTGLDYIIV